MILRLAVAFAALIFAVLPAQAAQPTWLPGFDTGQHVYVSPELASRSVRPVQLDESFKAFVASSGESVGVKYFIVATIQGDDVRGDHTEWARNMIGDLVRSWSDHPDFPRDRAVVILWIKNQQLGARGSVAAWAGDVPTSKGLTRSFFAASDGPLLPPMIRYSMHEPERALRTVIANMNQKAQGVASAASPGSGNVVADSADAGLPWWVWALLLGGGGLAVLLVVASFSGSSGGRGRGGRGGSSGSSGTSCGTAGCSGGAGCGSGGCGGGGCGGS